MILVFTQGIWDFGNRRQWPMRSTVECPPPVVKKCIISDLLFGKLRSHEYWALNSIGNTGRATPLRTAGMRRACAHSPRWVSTSVMMTEPDHERYQTKATLLQRPPHSASPWTIIVLTESRTG